MRGYTIVDQWHASAKTWDELVDPAQHRGDAASIDQFLGFTPPTLLDKDPGWCCMGEVVLRVEDDGKLTVVHARYDSSG